MKMIDADALFKSFESEENPEDSLWTLYGIKRKIEDAPTQEPRTGHWIALENRFELGDRLKCSECSQVFVVGDEVSRNYCPNCGAKMAESEV